MFIVLIGGCSFTAHSWHNVLKEEKRTQSVERLEILKTTGKIPER
jgi:hypothetical protein